MFSVTSVQLSGLWNAFGAQLEVIMDVLNQFAKSSGLVLNLQKSQLFFATNVQSPVANSLSTKCGIPLTSYLGTYLGILITHGRHSCKNYEYLLERVLIGEILLPNATCDAIDCLNRDFLWGFDTRAKKPHLVSWDVVCSEKRYGGLGLRSAWDNNQAFIAKLGWRILKGDNALWCRVMHTKYLRGSNFMEIVWSLLGFARSEFFTLDFFSWLQKFSTPSRTFKQDEVSRVVLFLSAIWLIWKEQNALIFWNHRSRPHELCAMIFQHAKYTEMVMSPSSPVKSRLPQWVSWAPLVEGWYKLNSDGSFHVASNFASVRGPIRDFLGNWIFGFVVNVGCASIFIAELWGLRKGLKLCKSPGIAWVVAEMDSLMAVKFINENRESNNLSAAILMDIKNLMSEFEECILQHTLREGNTAADFLVSLGHSSQPGLSLLDFPPIGLRPILTGDQLGASFLRF
ncbi:hypothetical protein SLE2022_140780 [Rubroshorea leprosula]